MYAARSVIWVTRAGTFLQASGVVRADTKSVRKSVCRERVPQRVLERVLKRVPQRVPLAHGIRYAGHCITHIIFADLKYMLS